MKKLLFLPAATFVLSAALDAQSNESLVINDIKNEKIELSAIKKEMKEERKELRKPEGKEVSYQVKQAFYADFGNIPVTKWERTPIYDKVTFNKDGLDMSAYYDYDAKLVGTTSSKMFSDIPSRAQKYINKKYSGFSKGDVVFFDDNELNETDMILYGNQFEDADNYFVELKKDNKEIVLKVNMGGDVSFFKRLK